MPSITRIIVLAVVVAAATVLPAQTFPTSTPQPTWPPPSPGRPAAAFPAPLEMPSGQVVPAAFEQPMTPDVGRPQSESRPLPPPSGARQQQSSPGDSPSGLPSTLTVAGSLAVVLGVFLLVAWGIRRLTPPGMAALPREAVEILGRAPLAGRQQVHLLRCGRKLLLVSVTSNGAETLTEVTDPTEVDRLLGLCEQAKSSSATATFRQVFGQLSQAQPQRARRRSAAVDQRLEEHHV